MRQRPNEADVADYTVGNIVPLIKPQECANYFAAADYDPD